MITLVLLKDGENLGAVTEKARMKFAGNREALAAIEYIEGHITQPLDPEMEGYGTVAVAAAVFEDALNLIARKSVGYGDAWKEQGWMGNLARVMSKTRRLRNMLWRNVSENIPVDDESVEDNAMDLINLLAFLMINRRLDNKWGNT